LKQEVREYWECHAEALSPGMGYHPGTEEFFEEVASHRYRVEPCVLEMAEFDRWEGKRALEVGCGTGTDLRQLPRAGARAWGGEREMV